MGYFVQVVMWGSGDETYLNQGGIEKEAVACWWKQLLVDAYIFLQQLMIFLSYQTADEIESIGTIESLQF